MPRPDRIPQMTASVPSSNALVRWSRKILCVVGLACLGWSTLSLLEAKVYDIYGSLRLSKSLRAFGLGHRGAEAARAEARASGVIGRIEIPGAGVSAIIAEGSDEATLRRSVGHLPDSAYPGEPGNVALAGHRETQFRGLRRLRPHERIVITTPDGVFQYRVEWIRVVKPDDIHVLEESGGPSLTLITCYPFGFVGRAPDRFVVRANLRPGVDVLAAN